MKKIRTYAFALSGGIGAVIAAVSCGAPVDGEFEASEADAGTAQAEQGLDTAFGTWNTFGFEPAPTGFLATHASLLRTGKILVTAGSSYNCCYTWGRADTRLWDPATLGDEWGSKLGDTYGTAPNPWWPQQSPQNVVADAFCSGHAHDDQGRVIYQGGLNGYGDFNGQGVANSSLFTPGTGTFTQLTATVKHWYPTIVAGVRSMFVFPGRGTSGPNPQPANAANILKLPYGTTAWADTGVAQATLQTYPRAHLLPNGKFFVSSPRDNADRRNLMYDPVLNTLSTTGAGTGAVPNDATSKIYDSWSGTAALLPLVASNGAYPNPTVAIFNDKTAYKKDLGAASPAWTAAGTRPPETVNKVRRFGNATMLPTGQIVLSGGINNAIPTNNSDDSAATFETEVYDPSTNTWVATYNAWTPRNYHGTTMLLPDGRIWSASSSINEHGSECSGNNSSPCDGNPNGSINNSQAAVEIFTPWYFWESRPAISSCPAKISTDGSQFDIGIGGSQGTSIAKVSLMRAGSATHSFDGDQRLVWLDIVSKTSSSVRVKAPYGAAAAPPGDYMVFALKDLGANKGFERFVPSGACWLTVEPQVARSQVASASMQTTMDGITSQNYRPTWIDGYSVGTSVFYNVVFTKSFNSSTWFARWGMSSSQYQTEFDARTAAGWRPTQVDSYQSGSTVYYAAIWESAAGTAWQAYHDVTEADHTTRTANFVAQGYRMVNVSTVIVGGARRYTALFDKASVGSATWAGGMTEAQYQTTTDAQVAAGRRVAYINGFTEGGVPKINAIYNQADTGSWQARHAVTSSQAVYDEFISQGFQERVLAGYESGGAHRFAGLFTTK